MLKEQLVSLAIKACSQAFEARARLRSGINSEAFQTYVRSLRDLTVTFVEDQWQQFASSKDPSNQTMNNKKSSYRKTSLRQSVIKPPSEQKSPKKIRKSSIRQAREIDSLPADIILQRIKSSSCRLVLKEDEFLSKKSLAYVIWALGHAELANITHGISVHDISALLYRAAHIELYPINISRMVYSYPHIVRKTDHDKRTKTYLLTPDGLSMFKEKFL